VTEQGLRSKDIGVIGASAGKDGAHPNSSLSEARGWLRMRSNGVGRYEPFITAGACVYLPRSAHWSTRAPVGFSRLRRSRLGILHVRVTGSRSRKERGACDEIAFHSPAPTTGPGCAGIVYLLPL
jgi:hypothetical protein